MDFALFNGIPTLAGLFIQLYCFLAKDVSSFHKTEFREAYRTWNWTEPLDFQKCYILLIKSYWELCWLALEAVCYWPLRSLYCYAIPWPLAQARQEFRTSGHWLTGCAAGRDPHIPNQVASNKNNNTVTHQQGFYACGASRGGKETPDWRRRAATWTGGDEEETWKGSRSLSFQQRIRKDHVATTRRTRGMVSGRF